MKKQEMLNRSMPAAARAKLGDVTAELVAQVNALTAAHNTMAAKLDADATVTGTDYLSSAGAPAVPLKDLEGR